LGLKPAGDVKNTNAIARTAGWVVLVSAVVCVWPGTTKAQSLPEGPGKDVFESVCSLCHSPTAPMGKQWTSAQWESKVIEMLQEEPDVTAKERTAIIEYLTANFRPGGKIYINKAAAKDLVTALEIPLKDAEEIVRYRNENGSFKSLDDLKKVSGLDSAKIEARKDRFEF
jgi:competence protein ComEA